MKRLLLVLLVLSIATAAFCGGAQEEAAETAKSEFADTIVIGDSGDIKGIDPNGNNGSSEGRTLDLIYEGLVRVSDDGQSVVPHLATKIEVSDDHLFYTVHLKPNVKFSDGTPVTTEDWIWSLYRARDTKESNVQSFAEPIKEITAPDENTLVIEIKRPIAPFISYLGQYNMVVQSKANFEKHGLEEYPFNPLGTGPYMLKEWVQEDYRIMTRNPHYHGETPPTENLKYVFITDDNTRLLQLQGGQIDIMGSVPVQMAPQVKNASGLKIDSFPSSRSIYMVMCVDHPPFDNIKARQAVMHLVNKDAIINLVAKGYARKLSTFIGANYGAFHNPDIKDRENSIEIAKKLLAEAGYTDDNPLEFELLTYAPNQEYVDIATIIKSQLAQAGVTVNINRAERGVFVDGLMNRTYQANLGQWTADFDDPADIGAFATIYEDSFSWNSGWNNKEAADTFRSTENAFDRDERIKIFHELQEIMFYHSVVNPLYTKDVLYGFSDKIEGLRVSSTDRILTANLRKRN